MQDLMKMAFRLRSGNSTLRPYDAHTNCLRYRKTLSSSSSTEENRQNSLQLGTEQRPEVS